MKLSIGAGGKKYEVTLPDEADIHETMDAIENLLLGVGYMKGSIIEGYKAKVAEYGENF